MHVAVRCANRAQYVVGNSVPIEFVLNQHPEVTVEIPAATQLDVVAEGLCFGGIRERRAKTGAGLNRYVVKSRLPISRILLVTTVPITAAILPTLLRMVLEHPRLLIQALS